MATSARPVVRQRFTGDDVSIPCRLADLAQDAQRGDRGVCELTGLGSAVGILELREHERVDPLGVRRPLDLARELGPDVRG